MGIIRDIASMFGRKGREEREAQHEIRMMALERAKVRMQKAWEAADHDRFRGSKWMTSQLSINSEMEIDLTTLWDRAEDLYRNDPYAASAINGRTDNVIGSGMSFHSRLKPFGDLISENDARDTNNIREMYFRQWAKKDKFRAKQRLFEKSKAIFGEGLGVMSDVGLMDGRPIPLTWQVINSRRLETPPVMEGNPLVRLGIEFSDDSYTKPVAYYIRDVEKNDNKLVGETYTRFEAWRVTHSFEALVPGQIRGVPWLAPVMGLLKDRKDYAEAKLIAEQVTACTTTFIKTADPHGRAIGASTGVGTGGRRLQEIEPGRIEYIEQDDEVEHVDPNRPGNSYAPFIEHNLMGVSAGLRYPYALLTKDFRKASFANGRLEMSDGRQTFEVWQQLAIDDAFAPIVERATEEMVILGLLPNVDASAYRAFPTLYNAHQLKPTRFRMAVNPKQETDADAAEVENLFASRSDKCDERESDFDDILAATEREEIAILEMQARVQAKREELNLVAVEATAKSETEESDELDNEALELKRETETAEAA